MIFLALTLTFSPLANFSLKPVQMFWPDDRKIEDALRRAIFQNYGDKYTDLILSVKHGEVTLEGGVDTQEERNDIELMAKSIPEVVQVTNLLYVRHPNQGSRYLHHRVPSDLDHQLSSEIRDFLEQKYDTVTFSVDNGNVTLHGSVSTIDDKALIEHVITNIPGVRSVINQITTEE